MPVLQIKKFNLIPFYNSTSMNSGDFYCPTCLLFFNKDDHLPLFIPSCGHTICRSCVQSVLHKTLSSQPFICPQDGSTFPLTSLSITQFKTNMIILSMFDRKEPSLPDIPLLTKTESSYSSKRIDFLPPKRTFSQPVNFTSDLTSPDYSNLSQITRDLLSSSVAPSPRLKTYSALDLPSNAYPTSLRDYNISKETSPLRDIMPSTSVRSSFQIGGLPMLKASLSRHGSIYESRLNRDNVCREHGKPLEYVCLNHQCRVCANCGLVGSHKNHDIRTEEEAVKEIADKAEQLLQTLEVIESTKTLVPETQFYQQLTKRISEKAAEVENSIHSKFEEYISILRARQERMIEEVRAKFSLLQVKVQGVNQVSGSLRTQMDIWKQSAMELIYSVGEKSEKGELAYDLIDDKYSSKPEMVRNGHQICREIMENKQTPFEILERELSKINVVFNNNFSMVMDSLCMFIAPEASLERSEKKQLMTLSPESDMAKTFKRLESINDKVQLTMNNNTEPENDLLTFDWKDLESSGKKNPLTRKTTFEALAPIIEKSFEAESQPKLPDMFSYGELKNYGVEPQNFHKSDNILSITSSKKATSTDHKHYEIQQKAVEGIDTRKTDPMRTESFEQLRINTPSSGGLKPNSESTKHGELTGKVTWDSPTDKSLEYDHRNQILSSTSDVVNLLDNSSKDFFQAPQSDFNRRLTQRAGTEHVRKDSAESPQRLLSATSKPKTRSISPLRVNGDKTPKAGQPKKKVLRVSEKYEKIIDGIISDYIEIADLCNADLGDSGIAILAEYLKENRGLKTLKLVKNKISDDGAAALVNALYKNNVLETLHLSHNQLTERTLGMFVELFRVRRNIRHIFFNNNPISLKNAKSKVNEIKSMDIAISL